MIGDSASHRVFKINELARAIASQLIPTDQESTVNLACTCRYLEEPVLSALWETQIWLDTLLQVLPGGILDRKYMGHWDAWEVRGLDFSLETSNVQVRLL